MGTIPTDFTSETASSTHRSSSLRRILCSTFSSPYCFALLANSAGQLYQGSRIIITMLTPPGTRGRPGRRVFGWSLRTAPTLCSSFDESFKFQTACQSYQRLQKHLEHSLPFWLKIDYAVHLSSSWMISNAFLLTRAMC